MSFDKYSIGENNRKIYFNRRDQNGLGEDSNDSTLSARELRAIPEEYGIDVSRVTVSESLREMHLKGIFQEAVISDEDYLFFSFFEY